MWQTPHLKSLIRSFKILDSSVANSASRSLRRGSILSASGVTLENFKTCVCAFNICPTFQSSDASLILGLHSDPYFLSLRKFNLRVFFLAGLGHIVGVGSSVFSASTEVDMK